MRQNLSQSFIQRATLSMVQMLVRGYEPAPSSILPATLRSITPSGSTAMRDAIVQATVLMLDLFKVVNEQNMAHNWNFVHVILTDGDDNASKCDVAKTKQVLRLIHDQLRGLNLKIIFIGVGVGASTASHLRDLARSAGENGSYYDIAQNGIENIFAKITVELGLQFRRDVVGVQHDQGLFILQRDQVRKQITVTQNNYAILFNLDISGSMSGNKWKSVCNSVQRFASNLSNVDFIGGIVFNQNCKLLLNERLLNQLRQAAQNSQRTQKAIKPSSTRNYSSPQASYNDPNQVSPEQMAQARRTLMKCCCGCCLFIIGIIVLIVVLATR